MKIIGKNIQTQIHKTDSLVPNDWKGWMNYLRLRFWSSPTLHLRQNHELAEEHRHPGGRTLPRHRSLLVLVWWQLWWRPEPIRCENRKAGKAVLAGIRFGCLAGGCSISIRGKGVEMVPLVVAERLRWNSVAVWPWLKSMVIKTQPGFLSMALVGDPPSIPPLPQTSDLYFMLHTKWKVKTVSYMWENAEDG